MVNDRPGQHQHGELINTGHGLEAADPQALAVFTQLPALHVGLGIGRIVVPAEGQVFKIPHLRQVDQILGYPEVFLPAAQPVIDGILWNKPLEEFSFFSLLDSPFVSALSSRAV